MAVSSKSWVFITRVLEPSTIQLKEERIYHWMSNGAQPSESAMQVFKSVGLLDRYERYKKGEALDTLMQEAESAQVVRNVNPQTRRESSV